MTMADNEPSSKRFELSWNESFPGETLPQISCLNKEGNSDIEQQAYRNALKSALDYHSMRISDLKKKLDKEQFIVEFVAQELEKLPVPRQSPVPKKQDAKPKPMPRIPPAIPKKPDSALRDDTQKGVLRRNKTTPSPAHSHEERRFQFNSAILPSDIIYEAPNAHDTNSLSDSVNINSPSCNTFEPKEENLDHQRDADERFTGFKGNSFVGASKQNSFTVSECVSNNDNNEKKKTNIVARHSGDYRKAKVSRDSMKRMEQIDLEDSESSDDSSQCDSNSDYMTIWNMLPPTTANRNSNIESSSASVADNSEENVDNSSAASITSTSSQSQPKKGSRMVRVDYTNKNGLPVAVKDDSIDNQDCSNSDEEDDKPQYVRLMYKAYSTVNFIKPPHSPSSNSTDSTDAAGQSSSPQLNSLSAKYRYMGRQRHTMFFDSEFDGNSKTSSNENLSASGSVRHQLQSVDSVTDATLTEESHANEQMRNWVVNSVLQSETSYLEDLNVLLKYKKSLEQAAVSSVPMIGQEDISTIFGNLQEIYDLHFEFKRSLEPIVAEWTPQSQVAYLFKAMAEKLSLYQTYLDKYPKSIQTVKRCCQENESFEKLVKEIKCSSTLEKQHLIEILHRPITRMQRNSLLLQDLIKCTHQSHPDHNVLQRALGDSQLFLREKVKVSSTGNEAPLHVLVKNQLLVEYVSDKARKLRHVFLFNDLLVCTKCRIAKGRYQYEVKWFIPLCYLELSDKMDDTPVEWKQKIEKAEKEIKLMKSKLKELKAQLRKEIKECKDKKVETSTNHRVQRLTRKIQEQEGDLILAEPRLRLTLRTTKGTNYCFLLPSDYERREWQESLKALKNKIPAGAKTKMTVTEAQTIVDTCKDSVQLNNVDHLVMNEASDEDIVSGQLTVTVHKMQGLQKPCDTYSAIEVDSFGHFYRKAKTNIIVNTKHPAWNESFEIDLEASSTLRLICYQKTAGGDVLLGKCPLNLSKKWLKKGFQEMELSMNEVTLTVSIKYQTAEQTIRRIPSKVESGVFGMSISSTCKKEGQHVPTIVSTCIEDIEKRGLEEVGIYRVSASTTDVQRIKKAFDKSARVGITVLQDVEINAVTGALKLYFRELPQALFTEDLYPDLIEAYKIKDKAEQEKKMIALMNSLPDPNYFTMMAILKHLVKVGQHEEANKMPFHNLAVVFGPTLLKPADKTPPAVSMDLFSSGANDAMYQSGILFYYLTLISRSVQFR